MDLETGIWTQGKKLKKNLFFHQLVAISRDEVFICCGIGLAPTLTNHRSWIYNIATEVINEKSTSTYAQYGSSCGFVYLKMKAKKVIFCAGQRPSTGNQVEIFDIQENRWKVIGSFQLTHHIVLGAAFVFGDR